MFILRMQSKKEELQRSVDADDKMEAYDNFLMECKEAVQSLKEDLNAEMVRSYVMRCLLSRSHYICENFPPGYNSLCRCFKYQI